VFIRTTEPRHHRSVCRVFEAIHENRDIFKGKYEGYYCVSCEGFKQEKDLDRGKCPIHQTEPQWIEEENYFFRLSKYAAPLLEHFRAHPEFLIPESRRNEIVNVIESGLDDISVSRPGSGWGVPLPIDSGQRIYVWFDALINYITAVGYGDPGAGARFAHWWPADLHVIGKDITRFHCIIWPAMLLSAGIALPKQVLGHGWVTFRGEKLSKSLGNIVDPLEAAEKFGPDPLRYYLLKEVPLDRDGDFTWGLFIERYNTDLANDLGNLVSRTVTMAVKYFDGVLPGNLEPEGPDLALAGAAAGAAAAYRRHFEAHAVDKAITAVWALIRAANRYIEETAPFRLAKDDAQRGRLGTVLNHLLESVRLTALLLTPIMPEKCAMIRETIRQAPPEDALTLDDARWDPLAYRPADPLAKPSPHFPRIEA
jgi:methionyl-tRNA synthetase